MGGTTMNCAVCSAPSDKTRSHCTICGHALRSQNEKAWDRRAEAAAFEDLQKALESDETLLGATRGRMIGGWRSKSGMAALTMLWRYVNLGLTSERLLIQPLHASTG